VSSTGILLPVFYEIPLIRENKQEGHTRKKKKQNNKEENKQKKTKNLIN